MVELLLANHAEVNAKDTNGLTPLHCAADVHTRIPHKDVVELLLDYKADVNAKDNEGVTPLRLAIEGHPKHTVEFGLFSEALVRERKAVVELLRQHGGHE